MHRSWEPGVCSHCDPARGGAGARAVGRTEGEVGAQRYQCLRAEAGDRGFGVSLRAPQNRMYDYLGFLTNI